MKFYTRSLVLLLICFGVDHVMSESWCKKVDACTCSGEKGKINLWPLANKNGTARFEEVPTADGFANYSWNPCLPFNEMGSYCHDVAICQLATPTEAHPLGGQESAEFLDKGDNVQIKYSRTDGWGTKRQSYVTLVCDENQEGILTVLGEDPVLTYNMQLASKYACYQKPKPVPKKGNVTININLNLKLQIEVDSNLGENVTIKVIP